MRCYICDAALSEVHYNSDHEDYEPCLFCQGVIEDTIASFTDKPSASEDELGGTDWLAQYAHLLEDPIE